MGFSKLLPRQWLKVSANECCYHHHTCRMLKCQISLPGEEMCLYSKLNQKKERLKGFGTKNSSLPEHEPQSKPYCFPLDGDQTLPSNKDKRLVIT